MRGVYNRVAGLHVAESCPKPTNKPLHQPKPAHTVPQGLEHPDIAAGSSGKSGHWPLA